MGWAGYYLLMLVMIIVILIIEFSERSIRIVIRNETVKGFWFVKGLYVSMITYSDYRVQ